MSVITPKHKVFTGSNVPIWATCRVCSRAASSGLSTAQLEGMSNSSHFDLSVQTLPGGMSNSSDFDLDVQKPPGTTPFPFSTADWPAGQHHPCTASAIFWNTVPGLRSDVGCLQAARCTLWGVCSPTLGKSSFGSPTLPAAGSSGLSQSLP